MSASKVVIVVLILFAVLFAVGVGAGMRSGDSGGGGLDGFPSWVENLGSAFSPRVDFAALTGDCIDKEAKAFVLEPGSSCQIALPSHEDDTQNLKMGLASGTLAAGQYKAPTSKDTLAEQKVKLEQGKQATIAVLPEGGALSLECPKQPRVVCKIEVL